MKKRNLVIHTAVASALLAMLGSVQATTVSAVAPAFAKELLLGTTPNATALTLPTATIVANVSIPANSTVYVYLKLSGASISTMPTVTGATSVGISNADGTGTVVAGGGATLSAGLSAGSSTGTANPTVVAAGVDYVVFQVSTNAAVIGVGGTIATVTGLAVNNATALLTAPITVTASVGIGAPASRFGALATTASNYDATSTAASVATSVQGITIAAVPTSSAGLIDLTASPVGSRFTSAAISTTTAKLGTVTVTEAGTAINFNGTTLYTQALVTTATGFSAAVTAPAGFFAALGTTGALTLDASSTCAAGVGGTNGMRTAAFATAAAAAAATTVAIPSTALPTTGTSYTLCMILPAANTVALIAATPTVTAAVSRVTTGTALDSANALAATNLYTLALNGAQREVRTYIPVATVGYTSFVRVINTGSLAANISGQWVYGDGTTGTSATMVTSLASGASVTLTSTQVEAALGAPTVVGNNRPRLRVTAPTNGMDVQSFMLTNANGNFSDVTGAQ